MTFEEWWNGGNYPAGGFTSRETYEQDEELARHAWAEAYRVGHERGVSDALGTFPNGVPEDMRPAKFIKYIECKVCGHEKTPRGTCNNCRINSQ